MDLNEQSDVLESSEDLKPAEKRKYTKKTFTAEELLAKKEEKKETAPKAKYRKAVKAQIDKDELTKTLISLHVGVCIFLKTQAFMLTESEAKQLSVAICNFSEHFSFNVDPKVAASVALMASVAMIYLPKALMYKQELKHKQMEHAKNETAG